MLQTKVVDARILGEGLEHGAHLVRSCSASVQRELGDLAVGQLEDCGYQVCFRLSQQHLGDL